MAISTLADYLASIRQTVRISKTATSSSSQNSWFSNTLVDAGNQPAMSAISNTTTGVVPTDATSGFPGIVDFSGVGYLTSVDATNISSAGRVMLYDRLWHAGAIPAAAGTTTFSGQPSFSSRIPGGTSYNGLLILAEMASGKTGSSTCHVTYTDQSGNTGHSSGSFTAPSNVAAQSVIVPLASGDCGVQAIESFVVDSSSNGCTWNIAIIRPLWSCVFNRAYQNVFHFFDQTGMPQVWSDSALGFLTSNSSASTGVLVELNIEIASA
jgi:hypothetical protein